MKLLEEDAVIDVDFNIIDIEEGLVEIKDLQHNFIKSYIYSLVVMNDEIAIKIAFIRKDEIKKDE